MFRVCCIILRGRWRALISQFGGLLQIFYINTWTTHFRFHVFAPMFMYWSYMILTCKRGHSKWKRKKLVVNSLMPARWYRRNYLKTVVPSLRKNQPSILNRAGLLLDFAMRATLTVNTNVKTLYVFMEVLNARRRSWILNLRGSRNM